MPPVAPAVLFDIDGTLVDSNYLHVDAWSRAFDAIGRPVDAWRIHRAIGMGSAQLLDALLGTDGPVLGERAKQLHTEFYAKRSGELRPFADAAALIRTIGAHGISPVLATSAVEDELERLLAVLGIADDVAAVVSAEDVAAAKPEPDLVQAALARAGSAADAAIFVGDSVWDVKAAAKAGVAAVGVLTGGTGEAELRAAGAQAVYDDCSALLAALDTSPLAALWAGR